MEMVCLANAFPVMVIFAYKCHDFAMHIDTDSEIPIMNLSLVTVSFFREPAF